MTNSLVSSKQTAASSKQSAVGKYWRFLLTLLTVHCLLLTVSFAQIPARSFPILCIRDDALSTLAQAEGQSVPCRVDANGGFWVTAIQSGTWSITANAGTNLNTSALALDATLTNRLPAGSTPADNESNAVTISRLGTFNYIFDGTTWDRWTGAVSQSGSWTVAATQSGTWTVQPGNTANTTPWLFQGNLSNNGAAAGTNRLGILPAIAQSNLPSVFTAGRDVALRTDLNGTLAAGQLPLNIATYSANKLGLVSVASATDIARMPGNATNTVIVTRIAVSCTQTTAGIVDVQLIKRSTAGSGGTSANTTVVPHDSGMGAGVSVPVTYTANPTAGTLVGNIDSAKLACLAPATASPADIYIWKPSMGQSVVLRGTAENLAVNLNGVTVTGSSFNVTFDWIETTGL